MTTFISFCTSLVSDYILSEAPDSISCEGDKAAEKLAFEALQELKLLEKKSVLPRARPSSAVKAPSISLKPSRAISDMKIKPLDKAVRLLHLFPDKDGFAQMKAGNFPEFRANGELYDPEGGDLADIMNLPLYADEVENSCQDLIKQLKKVSSNRVVTIALDKLSALKSCITTFRRNYAAARKADFGFYSPKEVPLSEALTAANGIPLRKRRVIVDNRLLKPQKADGNCLFYCIAEYLKKHESNLRLKGIWPDAAISKGAINSKWVRKIVGKLFKEGIEREDPFILHSVEQMLLDAEATNTQAVDFFKIKKEIVEAEIFEKENNLKSCKSKAKADLLKSNIVDKEKELRLVNNFLMNPSKYLLDPKDPMSVVRFLKHEYTWGGPEVMIALSQSLDIAFVILDKFREKPIDEKTPPEKKEEISIENSFSKAMWGYKHYRIKDMINLSGVDPSNYIMVEHVSGLHYDWINV
ncbi:MAG: hypothetical protein GWP59_01390 [Chlamydiales bacterium]|nr:hypothetical protein [Chlamydiales bacterium]NCF70332.1 hypothetical protein [Chlamydiales bacterium]